MPRNEILDQIYSARKELLAQHGGDLHAYIEAARKQAIESGRPIATPKQRTIRCSGAAKSHESQVDNLSSPPAER